MRQVLIERKLGMDGWVKKAQDFLSGNRCLCQTWKQKSTVSYLDFTVVKLRHVHDMPRTSAARNWKNKTCFVFSHPCIKDPLNRTRLCNIRKTSPVNESRKMRIVCVWARQAWVNLPYLTLHNLRCVNAEIMYFEALNQKLKPNQMWVNVVYGTLIHGVCCFLIKVKCVRTYDYKWGILVLQRWLGLQLTFSRHAGTCFFDTDPILQLLYLST